MKRIILFLAFIALSVGANAQAITAANGTVVVKSGTVSIVGGVTGTFVASGTGTTVISGTPTVVISSGTITTSPSGTQAVSGTVSITNNTLTVQSGSISITNTPTVVATFPSSNLTLTSSSVTTGGTVSAGSKSVLFETSDDYTGNIDGVSADAGASYPFSSGDAGTLPAIVYTVSTGSIRIRKLN